MTKNKKAAGALATEPLSVQERTIPGAMPEAELDRTILNAAILNGALEFMPQSLATLAIVPLQMRLVYRIGKSFGYELARGHIADFLATVGVGLTSQVIEGYARRILGGFTLKAAGRLVSGLVGQATGFAFAFATTYALGQVAKRYYANGRTLSVDQLKETFATMVSEGRSLQNRNGAEIADRTRHANVNELLPLVKQSS